MLAIRRNILQKFTIVRSIYGSDGEFDYDDFHVIYGKFVEKIKYYTLSDVGKVFINELEVEYIKADYIPKIGDLVYMTHTNFVFLPSPEYDFGYGIKAVKLDAPSTHAKFVMVASDELNVEIVRTKFIANVGRRTYNVVNLMDMDIVYHNPETPPPADIPQKFMCNFYLPTGQRADWLSFEQRDNNSVFVLNSGDPFTGTVTIERR